MDATGGGSTAGGSTTAEDKGKAEDEDSSRADGSLLNKQDHLVSKSYKSLLSSPLAQAHASVFVVSYEFYVSHGKDDQFLEMWWKHEATVKSYWLGGYLSKVERTEDSLMARDNSDSSGGTAAKCDKFRGVDENRRMSSRLDNVGEAVRKLRVGGPRLIIERKCKNCGRPASMHPHTVFSLYTEWKNRLAWEAALPNEGDITSEEMEPLFARPFQCEPLEMVLEQVPELPLIDDFSTDDWADSSHATESVSELRYSSQNDFSPNSARKKKSYMRMTVIRARNLPVAPNGSPPYSWTVQAGYSKVLLTSSERKGDPVEWKEEFHWKVSSRHRRIYIRLLAKEDPAAEGTYVLETRGPSVWIDGTHHWVDVKLGDTNAQLLISLVRGIAQVDPVALFNVVPMTRGESEDSLVGDGKMQLFKEIKFDGLQTGDLVVFTGTGWVGDQLKRYEKRRWVQVGMVMVFTEYDMILVWELSPATVEVKRDATTYLKFQMQLTDIATKVTDGKYDNVGIRRLQTERTEEMLSEFLALRKTEHGQVMNDLLHLEESNELEDLTAVVTAQLIAGAYEKAGLLELADDLSSADFTPALWMSDELQLTNDASLSEVIWIERTYDKETKKFNI